MNAPDRWLHDGWLRPVDHALADTLRRLRPDSDPRVLLAAALCSRALAFGHSGLPLGDVAALCLEIDSEQPPPPTPLVDEWLAALRASPWVRVEAEGRAITADDHAGFVRCDPAAAAVGASARSDAGNPDAAGLADAHPLVLDGDTLYLRRYHQHEVAVADALRVRIARPLPPADDAAAAWREARLRELFPLLAEDSDDAQAAAARALASHRVLLLSGGPGTGKTTTIARALALAIEEALRAGEAPPRIALAAPTGKAATRLAESMRQALASHAGDGMLAPDVVAALPTDARTLHRLLGWRPGAAARHDAAQPLPVDLLVVDEASMVDLPMMARLLAALPGHARLLLVGDPDQLPSVDTGDVLAALCASPSLPQVRLHRVHRQETGNAIGELAADVRGGDTGGVLRRLAGDGYAGVPWRTGADRDLPAALLAEALPAFRAVAAATDPAQALQRARAFRVLTALREGASGSVALNARIAAALHPAGGQASGFHGALLLITANSPRHGLFNGDIGVAWRDAGGELRAWFEAADGLRAWLPSTLPAHEPAFALTVHKSQGSEFDRVWLVLPEHGARVLSRELLYTGLTRARAQATLWAREPVLAEAIGRRAQRWSGLAARLR